MLQYQYVDSELDPDTAAQKRELDALAELGDVSQDEKINI